jgi:hypothetical protein
VRDRCDVPLACTEEADAHLSFLHDAANERVTMPIASSDVPVSRCVDCGSLLDVTTSVESESKPTPGSVTVCLMCGHIAAFADDLTLRELTREEQINVAGDPRILAIQRARKDLGIQKGKGAVDDHETTPPSGEK